VVHVKETVRVGCVPPFRHYPAVARDQAGELFIQLPFAPPLFAAIHRADFQTFTSVLPLSCLSHANPAFCAAAARYAISRGGSVRSGGASTHDQPLFPGGASALGQALALPPRVTPSLACSGRHGEARSREHQLTKISAQAQLHIHNCHLHSSHSFSIYKLTPPNCCSITPSASIILSSTTICSPSFPLSNPSTQSLIVQE